MKAAVELSAEDTLRLHVLLAGGAGEVEAIRIDESAPTLVALTAKGEAKVSLHPAGRADRYLTRVRELLGGHALGAPGGYPVHLRRWTRMGQASPERLAALLRLGEPEAVTAVAHAPNLTDELARRAWWALPGLETARSMLQHAAVRDGAMAQVLSDYLVEHLPFEEDPIAAMQSVCAVVAAGRLSAESAKQLWAKGKRRPHYLVGFLECVPDALPEPAVGRDLPAPLAGALAALPAGPWGSLLAREFSAMGQAWLQAFALAFDKPPAHEAVYRLFELLMARFAPVRGMAPPVPLVSTLPGEAAAIARLAALTDDEVTAHLRNTTAVGPLLRRKLAPVLDPILADLRTLAP